jgi:hypothetical protein
MRLLAVAFLLSGCSFLFVQGPPSNYQHMDDFHCTPSDTPPMLDVIFAGVNALDLSLVGSHQYRIEDSSVESAVIATDAILIAVHIASAIYGFAKTTECQEALANLSARRPHRFQNFLPPPPPPPPSVPEQSAPPPPPQSPAEPPPTSPGP